MVSSTMWAALTSDDGDVLNQRFLLGCFALNVCTGLFSQRAANNHQSLNTLDTSDSWFFIQVEIETKFKSNIRIKRKAEHDDRCAKS